MIHSNSIQFNFDRVCLFYNPHLNFNFKPRRFKKVHKDFRMGFLFSTKFGWCPNYFRGKPAGITFLWFFPSNFTKYRIFGSIISVVEKFLSIWYSMDFFFKMDEKSFLWVQEKILYWRKGLPNSPTKIWCRVVCTSKRTTIAKIIQVRQ